jgi:hypothetical protein
MAIRCGIEMTKALSHYNSPAQRANRFLFQFALQE